MEKELTIMPASTSLVDFGRLLSQRNHCRYVLVEDGGKLLGVVARDRAAEVIAIDANGALVRELAVKDYEVIPERTTVFELLSKLRSKPVSLFLVGTSQSELLAGDVKGVISKQRIADTMTESLGLLSG